MGAASVASAAHADPPPGYYTPVNTSTPAQLRSTLHDVIASGHIRIPYTSSGTDTWVVLNAAQQDPLDSTHIIDVYRNRSYLKITGGSGSYDREHLWPKNHGVGYNEGERQHTDCHQLFLSDSGYNSTRSDIPFGSCISGCSTLATDLYNGQGGPSQPNTYSSSPGLGRFQAWPSRRGDIARALFYMDVRYAGGADITDLVLTDNEALIQQAMNQSADGQPTPAVGYSGLLSTLRQWHIEDPVDQRDRDRNDVVYSFQNNRNPFVDHPEWVATLFGAATCSINADCDNGTFCDGVELCSGGSCVAGTPPCPAAQCNEATDTCSASCSTPAQCSDGLFCNGVEQCNAGSCVAGTPPCGAQICSEASDTCSAALAQPWINEFHYDNASTDTGEFVEIAGPAGLNLSGWLLVKYNGTSSVRAPYDAPGVSLTGVIPDQGGCAGTLSFSVTPIENGSPDGLALVSPTNQVVHFLSYEGSFVAASGPAAGMTAADIGVSEPGTANNTSLQLTGNGAELADFTWLGPQAPTAGQPNSGQSFDSCVVAPPAEVPLAPHRGPWLMVTLASLIGFLGIWVLVRAR